MHKPPTPTFASKYLMHRGRQTAEFENSPATLKADYTFKNPFTEVCLGQMMKFHYEHRLSLSTIADVKQVDADTVVYYRRQENAVIDKKFGYEKITMNRATGQMSCEIIHPNSDRSEGVLVKDTYTKQGDDTHAQREVFHTELKHDLLEEYKHELARVVKGWKFYGFEKE